MWYLIVLIPDLCTLNYFKDFHIDEVMTLWLFSGPPGFTNWDSFALDSVLCTVESLSISFLYLNLYVLVDDACISYGFSCKPNIHVS